jgi:hypothetical protein
LLNAYISQSIAHFVGTHGAGTSGTGVLQYVISGALEPWYTGTQGFAPNIWQAYLGNGWLLQALQQIHSADATAVAVLNFDFIETASASVQQAQVLKLAQSLSGVSGIPARIVFAAQAHGQGGYVYSNADIAALGGFFASIAALGFFCSITEYDNQDTLAQGQGAAGYPVRDQYQIANLNSIFTALTNFVSVSKIDSFGTWGGLSDQTSFLNNPPDPGTPYTRPDDLAAIAAGTQTGTTQRPCLLDVNYNRKGGAGSSQDVYGHAPERGRLCRVRDRHRAVVFP